MEINNDKRTHCNEIETIEHLFYNCSQTKSFITQIVNWINRTCGKHYTFSIIDLLFGIPSIRLDKLIKITNWIIIYAKWYMYSCNLANEKLFLLRFLTDLKHHAILEKYVELIRKPDLENCIWDILLNEL